VWVVTHSTVDSSRHTRRSRRKQLRPRPASVAHAVYRDEREARIEPFGDVALDVASWWL
jgi:hypothetical protein